MRKNAIRSSQIVIVSPLPTALFLRMSHERVFEPAVPTLPISMDDRFIATTSRTRTSDDLGISIRTIRNTLPCAEKWAPTQRIIHSPPQRIN
jgi:hypothetical protein